MVITSNEFEPQQHARTTQKASNGGAREKMYCLPVSLFKDTVHLSFKVLKLQASKN